VTGTDLARMDHNAVAVLTTTNDALDRLDRWVTAAKQASALVAPLVNTAFVPDAYRPKVDPRATPEQRAEAHQIAVANATAAVLQGITLGVDPMTALQQIYIVHGRPGMYAKMMVALVQAHGHEVWDEDLSDSRAVVCGRRKGTEHIVRVTITMDQARKAGWTSNQAYVKTPQDMLWSRAAARVCDRIASDVLKGIASVEEIRDTVKTTAEVGDGTRTVKPRGRAALTAVPAPAAEDPPRDDEVKAEAAEDDPPFEPDPPAEEGITTPQQRKLHTLLGKTGRGDRDVALVWIAGVIDREIESTKELTKREAMRVIDTLEGPAEPPLDEDWPPVAGAGESA
jgi:hypothetical protein